MKPPKYIITDPKKRKKILAQASDDLVAAGLDTNDFSIDDDARIVDNEDDGYWVTCRVFTRY